MTEAQKNAIISARILKAVQSGENLQEAIDSVLGEGTFKRVAGEIYDGLRAKASAV